LATHKPTRKKLKHPTAQKNKIHCLPALAHLGFAPTRKPIPQAKPKRANFFHPHLKNYRNFGQLLTSQI
jgi:hypothetical protein